MYRFEIIAEFTNREEIRFWKFFENDNSKNKLDVMNDFLTRAFEHNLDVLKVKFIEPELVK